MNSTEHPTCLIRQSACGRIAGEPICPKCGLDERVRFVSEEAGLLAVSKAETTYWQNHAQALEEKYNKPAPPPKSESKSTPVQSRAVGQVFQDLPIAPQMVVLPSGSFMMGSAEDDADGYHTERPQHKVTIAYKLALGRYPVTFKEWDACVADGGVNHEPEDAGWGRDKRPVINVSWDDAQAYAAWLNNKLGMQANDPYRYRLPTEAEWEYACRAGTTGNYSTPSGQISDNDATYDARYVNSTLSPKVGKSDAETTPVGIYAPNPWGLYDMHGNVMEWVQDVYEDSYWGAPADGTACRTEAATRVVRGGSWLDDARNARSAGRMGFSHDRRNILNGFRLARTAP
jgi:formylglycine-generating enzyme required for sulfatase activity